MTVKVPPLSRRKIREQAHALRELAEHTEKQIFPIFPIMDFLEKRVQRLIPDFYLIPQSKEEMRENHGLTYPSKSTILIRDDVYINAYEGKGRDRLTAAHELGHLMLHNEVGLARSSFVDPSLIKPYESSEWQANCFAGELLIPPQAFKVFGTPLRVSEECQVSFEAASVQFNAFKREGLI